MKKNKKQLIAFVFALLLAAGLIPAAMPSAYAAAVYPFDESNVLEDLTSADNFGITELVDLAKEKEPIVINFVEFAYTYSGANGNYALYVYIYSPLASDIKTDTVLDKAQMAVEYDSEGKPAAYEKFDLVFCNSAKVTDYPAIKQALDAVAAEFDVELNLGRFYKLRIVDHTSPDGKTIKTRVKKDARRYDISGIELVHEGATTAEEYGVGGTYIFTGYAQGCGQDSEAASTLQCDVNELYTIELEVHHTNFRTASSPLGYGHHNSLDTVYFSVPNEVLEKYGKLQKIKAEWWEYKLNPAIVTESQKIHDKLSPWLGKNIGKYSSNLDFSLYTVRAFGGGLAPNVYGYVYNAYSGNTLLYPHGPADYYLEELHLLFETKGKSIDSYHVPAEEVKDYIKDYNASFKKGYIPCKDNNISADLFTNSVDQGREMGYNLKVFDADNSFNMLAYDSNNAALDWFVKTFLGWNTEAGSDFEEVKPIVMLNDKDNKEISGIASEVAQRNLINVNDVDAFKKFYTDAKAQDRTPVLFRFAVTDYFSLPLVYVEEADLWLENPFGKKESGIAQQTVFLNFDIMELTFNRDGVYTMIPVVASPIDIINGYDMPKLGEIDWWIWLIVIVVAILLIVGIVYAIIQGAFPMILKVIGKIFSVIGKGIWLVLSAPVKLIISAVNARKNKEQQPSKKPKKKTVPKKKKKAKKTTPAKKKKPAAPKKTKQGAAA